MRILVLAGTRDGRELAVFLFGKSLDITISVASEYGREILDENLPEQIEINSKRLDQNELENFMKDRDIKILVDASHPYAENVSMNAIEVCRKNSWNYIRYERPEIGSHGKIYHATNYLEAARKSRELGQNIFLTTGSKTLEIFCAELKDRNIIARVLPTPEVIQKCLDLGLQPRNIVAMQGSFSRDLNRALFKNFCADVIVTKDSGKIGGVDSKIEAAEDLTIPVVMIDRPRIDYPNLTQSFDEVLNLILKLIGELK